MTTQLVRRYSNAGHRWHWPLAFAMSLVAIVGLFLLAPWSLQEKSLAALHGLCAQTPGHSFWFGETRLPFDGRMTGIYGGFLLTQVYLLARGRLYRIGLPPVSIMVGMIAFVAVMGVDGFNSLFTDIGLPHPYEPSNYLRYITGALTGTTLAIVLWLLFNSVLWTEDRVSKRPIVLGWKDLIPVALMVALFGVLIDSGWPPLFPVLSLVLILSGLLVISMMTMVVFQSVRGGANALRHPIELAQPAIPVVIIAIGIMAGFSTLRAVAERALGA